MATGYGRRVRRLMVDFVAGKTPTAPTAWYISLHTTNPGDDGQGGGEPTLGTGGYARKQFAGGSSDWTAAPNPSNDAAAVSANSGSQSFATSTAAWSTGATNLTHFGVWDSATLTAEANFIGRGSLTTPQAVNASGITITIATSAIHFDCISA